MKQLLKKAFRACGWELRRVDTPMRSMERGLLALSDWISPRSVIDAGVAWGTPELYQAFSPKDHSYLLVEANPRFVPEVKRLADELGAKMAMVFCGESEGVTEFTVFENQGLSSAYPAARAQRILETVTIPVRTLDALVRESALEAPYLLKLDVEGAELLALRGAETVLKDTQAVIIEIAIAKRRLGAPEFSEIVAVMHAHGFSVFDLVSGSDWKGRLSLFDAIFMRDELIGEGEILRGHI